MSIACRTWGTFHMLVLSFCLVAWSMPGLAHGAPSNYDGTKGGLVEICDDGIDNNMNGFIDCEDFECIDHPACKSEEELLVSCPIDAAVSQPPAESTTSPGFSDESDNMIRSFDNFTGLTEPITGIVWWGGGVNPTPCVRNSAQYEVAFYDSLGGQPGAQLHAETVSLSIAPTETDAGLGNLLRFEATFAEPLDIASGWVSVYATGIADGCFFYWANGTGGDNLAYNATFGSMSTDFAFCLITAPRPHTADQNGDNIISLSELLRVIQFFNSSGLHCANPPESTEDGYVPNANAAQQDCSPHDSDYNPQNWIISLSELLRLIQFFNTGGYFACDSGEDNFCPGQP